MDAIDTRPLITSAIALLDASQVLLSFEYLLAPEFAVSRAAAGC